MDEQVVLIDQAGLDQRAGEPCPTVGEQVSLGVLLLEPRDGVGQISADDRRLVPVGGRERLREHDLGDLVHRLGEGPGVGRPVGGHCRVGRGAHEVRVGVAHGLDTPIEGVTAASRGDPVGAPVMGCDVAVERDRHLQDQCGHELLPSPGWMTRAVRVDDVESGPSSVRRSLSRKTRARPASHRGAGIGFSAAGSPQSTTVMPYTGPRGGRVGAGGVAVGALRAGHLVVRAGRAGSCRKEHTLAMEVVSRREISSWQSLRRGTRTGPGGCAPARAKQVQNIQYPSGACCSSRGLSSQSRATTTATTAIATAAASIPGNTMPTRAAIDAIRATREVAKTVLRRGDSRALSAESVAVCSAMAEAVGVAGHQARWW